MRLGALKYLGGAALVAGAVSAVIAAGGNAAEPSPVNASRADQATQAVAALLARGTPLTGDEKAALQTSPAVTAINGDLARARSITPPEGAAEKTPWFVVPASDGSGSACLDVGNGVVCGAAEQVATTGIAVFRVEQPRGAGKTSVFAPGGRAYMSGIVPSNVTSIVVLNRSRGVVKQVDVVGQTYRLDIATEDLGSVEYRNSEGLATAVSPIAD
jgi:hypothetical protein